MNVKELKIITGLLIKQHRQELKKGKNGKTYTIEQLLIPTKECHLPTNQKQICSNRTIMKIEKGIPMNNDEVYRNIAIKLHRTFHYNKAHNEMIDTICTDFLNHLFYKNDVYTPRFKTLSDTTDYYYKEVKEILETCISFVFLNQPIYIEILHKTQDYFTYLSEKLQYVIIITLLLYHFFYTDNKKAIRLIFEYLASTQSTDSNITQLKHYFFMIQYAHKRYHFDFLRLMKKINNPALSYPIQLMVELDKYGREISINQIETLSCSTIIKGILYMETGFYYAKLNKWQIACDYMIKGYESYPIIFKRYEEIFIDISKELNIPFESYITKPLLKKYLLYKKRPTPFLRKRLSEDISHQITSNKNIDYNSNYRFYLLNFYFCLYISINKKS